MLMFEIKELQTGSLVSGLPAGPPARLPACSPALDGTWRRLREMGVDERALQAEGRGCDGSLGQARPSLRVCSLRERIQAKDINKKGSATPRAR